jgi:tetrahydromethanopterin S-methyltransferase subunit B
MTNFVFGILIGLFIVAALIVAALVFLSWRLSEPGALPSLLA